MRVPIEWLNDYVYVKDLSETEISNYFTKIGLMKDAPTMDNVLELEHRMDRSDWLSILGCARDFAAISRRKLIEPQKYAEDPLPNSKKVEIKVECPDLVFRFNTRIFRGVKVQKSPAWLSERLEAYGIPSINNIVDITNYVMVELGQPMHAMDLEKFEKHEIVLRRSREGEQITTLDGTDIRLPDNILILAENSNPIAIGAIVGGQKTAISESTRNIILDAGNYNQAKIRQTSRLLKIRNETVLRTEKYLHPQMTQNAIERATKLILELAGGQYFENIDYYPNPPMTKTATLRFSRIKALSGIDYSKTEIIETLQMLDYKIIGDNEQEIVVEVPFFRTDFEVEDDIVADILRIGDYERIPQSPISSFPPKDITPKSLKFEDKVKDYLVNLGLDELITDPLVEFSDQPHQILLDNAISREKNALRTNLRQTLIKGVETYKKAGFKEFGIFEIGNIYFQKSNDIRSESDYEEIKVIEVILYNQNKKDLEMKANKMFFSLLREFGIIDKYSTKSKENEIEFFVNDRLLGRLYADGFSIFLSTLIDESHPFAVRAVKTEFNNNSGFDITVVANNSDEILEIIKQNGILLSNVTLIDQYNKNTTLRFTFDGTKHSIEEISSARENLINQLREDSFEVIA